MYAGDCRSSMTGGQIKGKVSRANAWLCLYRPQCTARVIKAAIGEGERATDVATPQMHRDSNFQQLFKALRERLDEDFRYTQKQDNQKLLTELFTGSQQYFRELAAINGPYHYLNISEAILAGINKTGAIDQPSTTRLQTTVKTKNGEGFSLETSLKKLWLQEKPHIIIG